MKDSSHYRSLAVASRVDRLDQVADFVEECAVATAIVPHRLTVLRLVVEEVFVNVCHYAYLDGEGEVSVGCSVDDDAFVLEVSDGGRPFDPLTRTPPDTSLDLLDRGIGGLGIHLVRTLSDSVTYRREDDRNILRMTFRDKPVPPG
jgi:anti-sigma regulatory factor (Ser/Thr protein kinase)